MITIGSFIGASIVGKNTAFYGDEVVFVSAEAINSFLNEFNIILDIISFSIENLQRQGGGADVMRLEVEKWTQFLLLNESRFGSFLSVFGVVHDTFIDGINWERDSDYDPTLRPWYIGAYKNNGKVFFSDPHYSERTGDFVLSASKLVFDDNNNPFGVISTNIQINSIADYVNRMNFLGSGYGVLLDSQRRFVVHPNDNFIGMELVDVNRETKEFAELSARMAAGEDITAFYFISYTNTQSVGFFRHLSNGWYLSIILPRDVYYSDMEEIQITMILAGIVLAVLLCVVLTLKHVKIHRLNKNDISKMEAGKLTLTPVNYDFSIEVPAMKGSEGDEFYDESNINKLMITIKEEEEIDYIQNDRELLISLKKLFLKNNSAKYEEITSALKDDDVKSAHRYLHSLKGNSGYIGLNTLRQLAADIEEKILKGKDFVTEEQLNTLKKELDKAVKQINDEINQAEKEIDNNLFFGENDKKIVKELLEKLEVLLKVGSPDCCNLLDQIRRVPQSEKLVLQIENYDFEPAVDVLNELKKEWC